MPLRDREVREQCDGVDVGVDAEVLRQVAEHPTDRILLGEHVDVAQADRPAIGLLQGCDRAHQRRLPGSVGPEEPEHARLDVEIDALQGLHAAGIGLVQVSNGERRASHVRD